MRLHEPSLVVEVLDGVERSPQRLDRVEGVQPQELVLQRSHEALGDSVALWFGDEARAGADAEEGELVLELVVTCPGILGPLET